MSVLIIAAENGSFPFFRKFSLPFTNSKVEQLFSHLKVIKSERRSSLCTSTLDAFMEMNMEGPPLESFTAELVVERYYSKT